MGLLDSVLGAVMNNNSQGQGGGLGEIIGFVTNNPQIIQAVTGMLSNDGAHGGLGGLLEKFQQAGLGDMAASWVSNGPNDAISGDQLTKVLGSDAIGGLASQLGLSHGDTANQLSSILPGLINHLTPNGEAPAGGLGDRADLAGMLGSLFNR